MKVVFLGLVVPNMNECHNMFTELVVEFRNNGHDIMVVAPNYGEKVLGIQIEDGIPTLRVPTMELFGVGSIQKGLATLLLPYQYKRALKKANINLNFDLVMMPTPPITLVNVASWLKRKYGSKMYLILRDIFPQNALDLGMMNPKGLAYAYFRRKEKEMYYASDYIGCMSPGNIDYVKKHNPEQDPNKLNLLPNWAWPQPNIDQQEITEIKKQYGLSDKFIVIFGGNIGKPQKIENIVALAKSCNEIKDIFFLIIGNGNQKNHLDKMILKGNMQNIKAQDFLNKDDFFKVLHIADVGLISLSEDFTIPNIPSKTLAYFNAKKPILAAIDKNTDMGYLLETIGAGVWAEANNTMELKDKLLKLYKNENLRKEMGQKGYDYYKNNLTTAKAYETIINNIQHSGEQG